MRPRYRNILIGLAIVLLVVLAGGALAANRLLPGEIEVPPPPQREPLIEAPGPMPDDANAEILWDVWGVPHIFARDDESLFHAYGYAQARNHGNLLLRLYAQARGRSAEYFGEAYLPWDEAVHAFGMNDLGRTYYEAQSPAFRANLDAFAAGINRYAAEHPDALAEEVYAVLPVTGEDVMMHAARVMTLFSGSCAQFVPGLDFVGDPVLADSPLDYLLTGSNGWAIGPERTAGGNAMLLANPHLLWGSFMVWHEAQLTAPELDAYGASLVGFPVLNIAFNDYLGWTHTVNTLDSCDLYTLTPRDDGYLFDDEVRPFETEVRTLRVAQGNGTTAEQELVIRRSVHGPVFERDGELQAVRIAGLTVPTPGVLEQWWDMGRAQDLEAFQAVLSRLQSPSQTIIYADRDGHIMSLFNGLVPRKEMGDADYWLDPVPGDTSETLWIEMLPFDALPQVVDPASGFVQNSNSPPWWTSGPGEELNPDDYPPYLAPRGPINLREQRGLGMLLGDDDISYQEMLAYKHDTYALLTDRVLDELIAAALASDSADAQAAAAILADWDRHYNADSDGAMLFFAWGLTWRQQEALSEFAEPWREERPLATPAGLADPEAAVALLEEVYNQLQPVPLLPQANLTDRPWSYLARLRAGEVDLPGNGGPGALGVFRLFEYAPAESGYLYAIVGETYIAAVEFTDEGPQAQVLLTYGNSSQPDSPHVGDQLWLTMEKELRPAWRDRAEIAQHLEDYTLLP